MTRIQTPGSKLEDPVATVGCFNINTHKPLYSPDICFAQKLLYVPYNHFHIDTNLIKKSGFMQQNLRFNKMQFFIHTYRCWHFSPL